MNDGRSPKLPEEPDDGNLITLKLAPSDQLLSIGSVNFILFVAAFVCLKYGYHPHGPVLPHWVPAAAALIIVLPAGLCTADSWWPSLRKIIGFPRKGSGPAVPEVVLKAAVFFFSAATILVLWMLVDRTGGVGGPFVPFLTAPAVFSPFVARNPWPIAGLCIAVVVAIAILSPAQAEAFIAADWTYKGVAVMMILIAGALTVIRLSVEARGGPLTGPAAAEEAQG